MPLAAAGLGVLCLVGAALAVTAGSPKPMPPSAPGSPSQTPAPTPSSVSPRRLNLGPSFFTSAVLTSRGTYRASDHWTSSCLKAAKPKLVALLRRTPCTGALQGAMYRSPNRRVYVQMTVMRFATPADAARMSQAISGDAAPRLHVPSRNEPAHWWSASHAGNHVLIRQSFVPKSNEPGERNGPAETYGDGLIRRFQAILAGLYATRQS